MDVCLSWPDVLVVGPNFLDVAVDACVEDVDACLC